MEKQVKDIYEMTKKIVIGLIIGFIYTIFLFYNVGSDFIKLNDKIDYLTKKVIQLDKPKIVETDTIITITTIDTVYQIKEYK
jgi:hypothetical protein